MRERQHRFEGGLLGEGVHELPAAHGHRHGKGRKGHVPVVGVEAREMGRERGVELRRLLSHLCMPGIRDMGRYGEIWGDMGSYGRSCRGFKTNDEA